MNRDLAKALETRKQQSLYRSRRITETPQAAQMRIDGRDVISFASNDYLGMANHPDVIKAFKNATDKFGVGSGAAHLMNGHSRYHHALEEALAEFVGTERALLFSTGYMANLGIVQALMGRGDTIFADRLNHASLVDGARLSAARLHRYQHADVAALSNLLKTDELSNRMLMTDGVFSMDGDIAPLPELAALAEQHNAWLLVDDAHGLGVLGQSGAGSLNYHNVNHQDNLILMGTLGKALGVSGAFVAGSDELIEFLIQTARTYIFTTAMPAATAAATLASLKIIRTDDERRLRLQQIIEYFRAQATSYGINLMPSETAIQGIVSGDNQATVKLSNHLWEQGILAPAIRPPTVPAGSARLRVSLSSEHKRSQIDRLFEVLASAR